MKLQLSFVVSYLLRALANSSPRLPSTLSASTKKPALTGWLPLPHAQHLSPDRSFSSHHPFSRSPRSLQLLIQTPSSP
jgi:hypothetical protein